MSRYFILRDGEVVEEPDFETWSSWYNSSFKEVEVVAETKVADTTVLTRFLGVSLGLAEDAPPQLFETTVEGGWFGRRRERFATLAEATAGHQRLVESAREVEAENALPPPGAGW